MLFEFALLKGPAVALLQIDKLAQASRHFRAMLRAGVGVGERRK